MKRLLVIAAFFFTFGLAAGSAADSGNLAAALNESDAARRISALLHALETAEEASPELLRCLNAELGHSGCDESVKKRLMEVWSRHPADIRTAWLVVAWVPENDDLQLELLEATFCFGDFSDCAAGVRQKAFELLDVYLELLERRYDLDRAGKTLDALVKKYPRDPRVAVKAAKLFALGCFRDTDTAPGLRNWDELSDENLWKSRLENLHELAEDMVVKDGDDAVALSSLALVLRDRDLLKEAVKIRRKVPVADDVDESVEFLCAVMKMPELLKFPDDDNKAFMLAFAGDIKGAKKALKNMSGAARQQAELFLLSKEKKHLKIRDMVLSGKIVPETQLGLFAVCEAAVSLKDTKLLERTIAGVEHNEFLPELANLLAYCCAELNCKLDKAEKWIRAALAVERNNCTYLDTYAWILFRKGEKVKAREIIGEALKNREADPSAAVLFLHAAEIELAVTGDKAAARQYLQRAERLYTPEVTDYRQEDVQRVKELLK